MNGIAPPTGVNSGIPFLDLKRAYQELEMEINEAVARVFRQGIFILGPEVEEFEKEWAQFCRITAAATTGNGTDALELALIASGVIRPGRGDEVITTPLTAAYTALAIVNAGGCPVFADIDPHSYLITPETIEAAITSRTRAIVPVHLYGQMADLGELHEIARRYDLPIIEDAAQAHGVGDHRQRPGALSNAAIFSFYPTKNLGAYGDGGAVVSNDEKLIERIKVLRQGGQATATRGNIPGMNSRLDELHAGILRVKLRRLDEWNQRRRSLAEFYRKSLDGIRWQAPFSAETAWHVWHLYVIRHSRRDRLRAALAARGIETMIHYPQLLHQQPLFRRPEQRRLPVAESIAGEILSLPLYPQLRPDEAQTIVDAIREFDQDSNL